MIKLVDINYTKGSLKQLRLFNIPIIQYEKNNDGKIKITFPLFVKPKTDRPVCYLKINSTNYAYSLWCMHHWINIVTAMGCDFYIICDNPVIEYKILEAIPFETSNIKFLKSDRYAYKNDIKKLCEKIWQKPAFAHLTTFVHARKNNIKEFWNIDADDTSFFEAPHIIKEALLKAENYARENKTDVFSFDMHRTRLQGIHFSFGISFVRMSYDILNNISYKSNKNWDSFIKNKFNMKKLYNRNFDWYFTYLSEAKKLNIQTFTVNNLYFVHWGVGNIYGFPFLLTVVKNKMMELPMMKAVSNGITSIPVYKDVAVFDTNIQEKSSQNFMRNILTNSYNIVLSDYGSNFRL